MRPQQGRAPSSTVGPPDADEIGRRISGFDWSRVAADLDERGYALLPGLLRAGECRELSSLYDRDDPFRSVISMERHRFGAGEYKYFDYPLPARVEALRHELYPPLAAIANRWQERLRVRVRFPTSHRRFVARCRASGQTRPTPLLLRYGPGGYNRLHQDLYGALAFPLQVACLLSRPDAEFRGGEFLLVESRPRMQLRGEAIALRRGEGIVFPNRERPARGVRGDHRALVRHGLSSVHSGERTALGIIFHDAK